MKNNKRMHFPPCDIGKDEHLVNAEDVADLPCTAKGRRMASQYGVPLHESEKVTRSDEFGLIYRCDVKKTVIDEEGEFEHVLRLVVSSHDGEFFVCVTYSMFELPEPDQEGI